MKPLLDRQRGAARTAGALLAVVVVVGLVLPVPFVSVKPGPVFDVLAEADGRPVVDVTGAPTYPTECRLDMVVVLQQGGTAPLTSRRRPKIRHRFRPHHFAVRSSRRRPPNRKSLRGR